MTFADPSINIKELFIHEGQVVADFGAGSGFYSKEAARRVGKSGKVYALEVQKELAGRLKDEARREGLLNIECLWANIELPGGTKLADKIADAGIISNVLFLIEDKVGFSREVARVIKPGGKILVIDWSESYSGMGPKSDHVYPKARAIELFSHVGFAQEKKFNAGAHHYGIIFRKT